MDTCLERISMKRYLRGLILFNLKISIRALLFIVLHVYTLLKPYRILKSFIKLIVWLHYVQKFSLILKFYWYLIVVLTVIHVEMGLSCILTCANVLVPAVFCNVVPEIHQ